MLKNRTEEWGSFGHTFVEKKFFSKHSIKNKFNKMLLGFSCEYHKVHCEEC